MQILNGIPHVAVAVYQSSGEGMGIVGGIVEHLYLEAVLRIIQLDHLFNEALHHIALVI
jgi:hypothetical protein